MTCECRLCVAILARISDTYQGLYPYVAMRVQTLSFTDKIRGVGYVWQISTHKRASAMRNTGTRRLHKSDRASGQHSGSKRYNNRALRLLYGSDRGVIIKI